MIWPIIPAGTARRSASLSSAVGAIKSGRKMVYAENKASAVAGNSPIFAQGK
jgi:hypothetical protein